jgi:hypothetical protein
LRLREEEHHEVGHREDTVPFNIGLTSQFAVRRFSEKTLQTVAHLEEKSLNIFKGHEAWLIVDWGSQAHVEEAERLSATHTAMVWKKEGDVNQVVLGDCHKLTPANLHPGTGHLVAMANVRVHEERTNFLRICVIKKNYESLHVG